MDQSTGKYALITVKPQFPGWTSNTALAAVDSLLTFDPIVGNNQFTKYTNVIRR